MLVGGSELAAPVDPSQALQMLVEAAEIASYAGDVTPTAEFGRRAAALPVVDKAGEFLSDLLQGMGRVAEGDGEHGGPLLRRAIALAGTLQDPRRLMWAGIAAFFLGETEAGNDTSACRHLCTLAHLAALRGDEDTCRALAAEARWSGPPPAAWG
jgi:hypothetical protein